MKKFLWIAFAVFMLMGFTAAYTSAQAWDTYHSAEFGLQFDVPSGWITTVDGDMIVSYADGVVLVVTAAKDESLSTYDLFERMVENLEFESEGEYEEIDMRGGIHGVLGAGAGIIEGEVAGILLLAATLDEDNFIAYIYAEPEAFDAYQDTLVEIITSLAPLGWEE